MSTVVKEGLGYTTRPTAEAETLKGDDCTALQCVELQPRGSKPFHLVNMHGLSGTTRTTTRFNQLRTKHTTMLVGDWSISHPRRDNRETWNEGTKKKAKPMVEWLEAEKHTSPPIPVSTGTSAPATADQAEATGEPPVQGWKMFSLKSVTA